MKGIPFGAEYVSASSVDLVRERGSVDWPAVRKSLVAWYEMVARPLPWREPVTPYRVWVSEIMLQQTTVSTVLGYYGRFLEQFPSVDVLADAPLEDLLKAWEGLGYYQRARNLHRAARSIVSAGGFPKTKEGWRLLPGIGDSTAGAIASIAFGESEPILDANVRRVNRRLFHLMEWRGQSTRSMEPLWTVSRLFVDSADHSPGKINQALMDLGATVCRIRNPDCAGCPLGSHCLTFRFGLDPALPKKEPGPRRRVSRSIWVAPRANGVFLIQRTGERLLEGLWDFPGCPPGWSPEERGQMLGKVFHVYTHFEEEIDVFEVQEIAGVRAHEAATWYPDLAAARRVPLTGVAKKILRLLEKRGQDENG